MAFLFIVAVFAFAFQACSVSAEALEEGGQHQHKRVRAHRKRRRLAQVPMELPTTTSPPLSFFNITPVTMSPPIVHLNPWTDAQPVDTAIGQFLATSFASKPPATPPPLQSSLDLVRAACPLLTGWPEEIEIATFDPCDNTDEGGWADALNQEQLVSFRQSCSPFTTGLAPLLTYSTMQGEVLASSHLMTTVTGNKVAISDCSGTSRYFLEEKVYHEVGSVDATTCQRFGSCDGTIWIQYFLYTAANHKLVAKTPYLKLFEDTIQIYNPTGALIASATRLGEWVPNSAECQGYRKWLLKYAMPQPEGGPFVSITEQWPLAALITIAATRDATRRPNGLLTPSWCEVSKVTLSAIVLMLTIVIVLGGTAVFLREALEPCRVYFYELERRIFPKRMKLPSKYDGG